MKVSDNLFEFHKKVEGYRHKAYRDSVGVLTIGVGHANQNVEEFNEGDEWDDEKIREVWRRDVAEAERRANAALSNAGANVSQAWFEVLVDIIFNTGSVPKTMLKELARGYELAAQGEILRWIYAGGRVQLGLVKRRMANLASLEGPEEARVVLDTPLSKDNLNAFNNMLQDYGLRLVRDEERGYAFEEL